MNYRKKGMPYYSMTRWKYYEYNFDAIQWVFDNGHKYTKVSEVPKKYILKIHRLRFENIELREALKVKSHNLPI